jgi:hypothetical protein
MTRSIAVNFTAKEVHRMKLSPAWQKRFRALQDSKAIFLLLLLLPVAGARPGCRLSP